jgi:hypothetical protein
MFGTIVAMEKEPKDTRFVDIVNYNVVDEFVSGYPVHYDSKYGVQKYQKDAVSFPVKSLSLLPIEYYGEKRFFNILPDYSTADPLGNRGTVFTVADPAIRQAAVVGGTVQYHDNTVGRIYLYLGFSAGKFRSLREGCERVYPATVMALQLIKEETEHTSRLSKWHAFDGVMPFDDTDMLEEVRKQRPETKISDWDDILVRSLMKKLLGRNFRDFNFEARVFTESYWNKREKMFKEIMNSSENK